MQVFGLPRHITRTGSLASRIAAKSSSKEAAIRGELVRRWRQAMEKGLTAAEAAEAVGASRASFYRWQRSAELKSRRPAKGILRGRRNPEGVKLERARPLRAAP
jgi:hypothetical protein